MNLQVLPLAITMMAGPQIMAAVVLVTHRHAVRVSLAYLAGIALAATFGVALARLLAGSISLGDPHDKGSLGLIIQFVLVGLLVIFAIKNYAGRETAEPPGWLGTMQEAGPGRAFTTGLLLVIVMPTDIMAMLTVGVNLAQTGSPLSAAIPFLLVTLLIAASPLLAYLLFRRRATARMPGIRDWMNSHGWLINIIVCVIFVFLII